MIKFADANSPLERAEAVVIGVCFEGTVSFRKGTACAPDAIRKEAHNFETFLMEHGVDLLEAEVHDAGNLTGFETVGAMMAEVEKAVRALASGHRFIVVLGGEHLITVPTVKGLGASRVIVLDAHLDFRDDYEGERYSHACTSRRIAELVGTEHIYQIGVRSACAEELRDAEQMGLRFSTAKDVREAGIVEICAEAERLLGSGPLHLSLDIDVIDPAYAPATGTPEPFGLSPLDVKRVVERFAPRLVGMDVVEVCPPHDSGNTASLAARLIREALGLRLLGK
ncbi:MAG: agmatinase [Candidatus Thermoplasmatota archaeon]